MFVAVVKGRRFPVSGFLAGQNCALRRRPRLPPGEHRPRRIEGKRVDVVGPMPGAKMEILVGVSERTISNELKTADASSIGRSVGAVRCLQTPACHFQRRLRSSL